MKTIQPVVTDCECECKKAAVDQSSGMEKNNMGKAIVIGLLSFTLWYVVYKQLELFSYFFDYLLVGLEKGSHLG